MSSNSIIYVDQSSRLVVLPVNGWASRISDVPTQALEEDNLNLHLEGSRIAFIDDHTLLVILGDGTVYPVEIVKDGKIVSKLSIGPALAQTTIPAVVTRLDAGNIFVGSTVGPSVLLRAARYEMEAFPKLNGVTPPTADVKLNGSMDLDDDEGKRIRNL